MKREFVKAVDKICERVQLPRGKVSLVAVEDGACLFSVTEDSKVLGTFAIPNQWVSTRDIIEGATETTCAAGISGSMNHALGTNTPAIGMSEEDDVEEDNEEGLATTTALNKDNDVGQIDKKWRSPDYLAQPKNDKLEAVEGRLYNVFVYGDLVDVDLRRELFGTDVPFEIAQLDDFMLANHVGLDGSVLVNVHMEKGQKVVGLILSLTQDQLNLADKQMDGWSRMVYPVQGEQCFVYFVRPEAVQESFHPTDLLVHRDEKERFAGMHRTNEEITPAKKGEVDSLELRVGTDVEREHTDSPDEAQKIALQHLAEFPDYYQKMYKAGLIKKDEVGEGNWKDLLKAWGNVSEDVKIVTFLPKLTETCTFAPVPEKTFTEGLRDTGAGIADQGTDTGDARTSVEWVSPLPRPLRPGTPDAGELPRRRPTGSVRGARRNWGITRIFPRATSVTGCVNPATRSKSTRSKSVPK
jgi:hypothetical protein